MTKDRVVAFMHELAYLIHQYREGEQAIAGMTSQLEIIKAMDAPKQGEQLIQQRMLARKQLEKTGELAQQKAFRGDVPGAARLLQQLQVRLEELEGYERDVAVLEARFELAATLGEFADGTNDRADVEALLDKARCRAATQLDLAVALVPSKPVVLSL